MDSSEERLAPYGSEPECGCIQVDVDRDDATGCEFHNEHSEWNCRRRAWDAEGRPAETVQPVQGFPLILTDEDCPFLNCRRKPG
jgi:hypothetical protein